MFKRQIGTEENLLNGHILNFIRSSFAYLILAFLPIDFDAYQPLEVPQL